MITLNQFFVDAFARGRARGMRGGRPIRLVSAFDPLRTLGTAEHSSAIAVSPAILGCCQLAAFFENSRFLKKRTGPDVKTIVFAATE